MASALTALANATATFNLPTVGTTTDLYGNVIPATESVTVSLYLRQSTPQDTTLPGVNAAVEVYEGYAVTPMALDARIKPGTSGTLSFSNDTAASCEVLATSYPYGTTGLIGSTVQQVLGDKIRIQRAIQR